MQHGYHVVKRLFAVYAICSVCSHVTWFVVGAPVIKFYQLIPKDSPAHVFQHLSLHFGQEPLRDFTVYVYQNDLHLRTRNEPWF